MNLYCPICGEGFDLDSLHDVAQQRYAIPYYNIRAEQTHGHRNPIWVSEEYSRVFERVSAEFRLDGCTVFDSEHQED